MQGDNNGQKRKWQPKERSPYDEAIREKVKELTNHRLVKQTRLAEKSGLHQSTVSKFISSPSEYRQYADDIAKALGVTTVWLLDAQKPYKAGDPIPASAQIGPDVETESADIWARISAMEAIIMQ